MPSSVNKNSVIKLGREENPYLNVIFERLPKLGHPLLVEELDLLLGHVGTVGQLVL